MGLDLMPDGQQGNSNSGPFGSHRPSTRGPLSREEAPFVHLRAVREPLGRAALFHSDHQGALGDPARAAPGGEPSVTPGRACSPRANERT